MYKEVCYLFVVVGFKIVIFVRLTALFDANAGTNLSLQQGVFFFVSASAREASLSAHELRINLEGKHKSKFKHKTIIQIY